MIAHFYPGLDIHVLTYPEIDDYIAQIQYVAPMVRMRYYLRDIKNAFFGMFSEDYQPDPELDEDENLEDRKKYEFNKFQDDCEGGGLIPPDEDAN